MDRLNFFRRALYFTNIIKCFERPQGNSNDNGGTANTLKPRQDGIIEIARESMAHDFGTTEKNLGFSNWNNENMTQMNDNSR